MHELGVWSIARLRAYKDGGRGKSCHMAPSPDYRNLLDVRFFEVHLYFNFEPTVDICLGKEKTLGTEFPRSCSGKILFSRRQTCCLWVPLLPNKVHVYIPLESPLFSLRNHVLSDNNQLYQNARAEHSTALLLTKQEIQSIWYLAP